MMKVVNTKILLKDYIFYLIQVLNFVISIEEKNIIIFKDVEALFDLLFINEKHFYKNSNNKLKYFLTRFRKLKSLLILKHDIILYNKIYKIFLDLKKLININEYLSLSLNELFTKNLFLYLPYNIEIKLIFKNLKIKFYP